MDLQMRLRSPGPECGVLRQSLSQQCLLIAHSGPRAGLGQPAFTVRVGSGCQWKGSPEMSQVSLVGTGTLPTNFPEYNGPDPLEERNPCSTHAASCCVCTILGWAYPKFLVVSGEIKALNDNDDSKMDGSEGSGWKSFWFIHPGLGQCSIFKHYLPL